MDVCVEHPYFCGTKSTETLEITCPQNTHPHAHNFPQNSPQIPNANPKKTEPTCSDSSSLGMATLGNVTLQNYTKHLKLQKLSRRMNTMSLQCKIWIISSEFRSFPIIYGRITRSCTMLFHAPSCTICHAASTCFLMAPLGSPGIPWGSLPQAETVGS